MAINDFQLYENFNLKEFQCKCGCECVRIDSKLVECLQRYRNMVGSPVIITSGYRCKSHNTAVGGAANSRHMYGLAVDVACPASLQSQYANYANLAGFAKVILYPEKNFLHLQLN